MTGISATWTDPKDWTPGETLTEPDFDNYLSSNLKFLKTPTSSRLANQATTTTTSASFVDITGVTLTISTNAYEATVYFVGSIGISTAGNIGISLLVDGVATGDAAWGNNFIISTGAQTFPIGIPFRTVALTAGSHTFKLQWNTSAGTATLRPGWAFFAIER
jgi:hypothetical protein